MTGATPFYMQLKIGPAFLGARTQRLADLISKQGDEFFQTAGIKVPARSVSTVLYLGHHGPSSLVQIAKALNEPHQLTAKRTLVLEELFMLSCKADPNDGRRRILQLTRTGQRESTKIEAQCKIVMNVFAELNRELDVHLGKALDSAYSALANKSILARSTVRLTADQHDTVS